MNYDLNDYPGLSNWFEKCDVSGILADDAEQFVIDTCNLLVNHTPQLPTLWSELFVNYLLQAEGASEAFISVQKVFNENNTDFLSFIGDLGEGVIGTQDSSAFQQAMESTADASDLACLRFLSAWICLNEGDMQKCVDQCDLITEDYAPIHTIKGQAQIELGHINEAILSLTEACKKSPGEVLAWFQLAKAYHITDQIGASWMALQRCRALAPQSAEVALFMGIVALEGSSDTYTHEAYESITVHQSYLRDNATINLTLIKLALRIGDREKTLAAIQAPDWDRIVETQEFFQEVAGILRELEALGQIDVAKDLLRRVTPAV